MFTGLIIELGEVAAIERKNESARLSVKSGVAAGDAALGDSIAVSGVCLTVVGIDGGLLTFDVSFETLKSTTLGALKRGDRVNLEPSLTATAKLGGHFVTGHVEAVGTLRSRTPLGAAVRIEIEAPEEVLRYLVGKGSVAVDGISLTVVEVLKDAFTVVIIPHTGAMTTIGFKGPGEAVNLEPDILAKYVAKFLRLDREKDKDASLLSALKQSGFIS